ncbi:MAG: hypothetical protein DDG58_12955 [Ardenticatenia bacterium]|nr:MAG: hypothetical protein DDG58_12955 [Ardenticatenia bacterium]
MNDQSSSDAAAFGLLDAVMALARHSWKHYGTRAAFLGRWLRAQSASGISRLRCLLLVHHLVQRQKVYRNAGGSQSSVARYALTRVAGLHRLDEKTRHRP